MKNRVKIVSICLSTLLVLSALCACLAGCHKNKSNPEKDRAEIVDSVENAFLSGVGEGWTNNLDQAALSERQDSGDYLVALGWTKMICAVVKRSDLQTEKIRSLATALSSQNGKTLLGDFEKNAELLIPLLKEVGFTPVDISSLVYELMCAMASEGASTIEQIYANLQSLELYMRQKGVSGESLDNVLKNRVAINLAKVSFSPTEEEKAQMLAAFAAAKNAMSKLVSFAYNMSVNAITDDLYGKLFDQDGALGSITESEIATLVDTLLANVRDLKSALTDVEIAKLNSALNLVIAKFDKDTVSSEIYAQIVKYAKYAYMVADIIPTICDAVTGSGNLLSDSEFIKDFLAVSQNGKELDTATNRINQSILVSRAIINLTDNSSETAFGKEGLYALIDDIAAQGASEYQKAVPLFTLDLMLNFSSLYDSIWDDNQDKWLVKHSDVMTQDALSIQLALAFSFNNNFDKFKETYFRYSKGEVGQAQLVNVFNACKFGKFIDNEKLFPIDQRYTKEWYEYYVTVGVSAVNEKVAKCMKDNVVADLKAFVDDYFAQGSDMKEAIKEIAAMSIVNENIDENVIKEKYIPLLSRSCVLGATILFMF